MTIVKDLNIKNKIIKIINVNMAEYLQNYLIWRKSFLSNRQDLGVMQAKTDKFEYTKTVNF